MKHRAPWIAALLTLALHLVGNAHYGFFRDELYFIICGFSPQWGYVDQPPVVPLLAALTQLGGHSLFLLRAVPALCAAAGAFTTVLLVVEFGGGAFAQTLATVAYLGAPVLIAFGAKAGPDEMGLALWPLIALWLVRLVRGADPRWWLAVGTAGGIACESKYSVLFFFAALFVGLVLTPERRILRSRWALAGIALGALVVLPNFVWQARNGFPMWELLEAGQHGKNVIIGPLLYLVLEAAITNLFLAPLWIIGVVWLLRTPAFRFLGYTYLVLILEMIVLHGKHYYPADVYPIVIAAGAIPIAAWTARVPVLRVAIVAYAVVFALIELPVELPVLSETTFVAYQDAVLWRLTPLPRESLRTEHGDVPAIGSDYADMHGWPEFAAAVRRAYDSLPPAERAQTVIFAVDYGQASALRFFEPTLPVISGHNQYWLWGYGAASGQDVLELGGSCWKDDRYYTRAQPVAHYTTTLPVMPYENDLTFLHCHGLRVPIRTLWNDSKNYI
jgi:hypothetical protein